MGNLEFGIWNSECDGNSLYTDYEHKNKCEPA